jgi:hypothetical protein
MGALSIRGCGFSGEYFLGASVVQVQQESADHLIALTKKGRF